jgi:GMP synthase PP-ATPase subunit
MGDQWTYAYACVIRDVYSEGGVTADWVSSPMNS